jgi:hypothetical protein
MRSILFILLLQSMSSYAQSYSMVTHLQGTEAVGANMVTVTPSGKAPGNMTFNGVSPYHIGNKKRANGFDFRFDQPVKKLRLHFTAINDGEKIELGINGRKYLLTDKEVKPYEAGAGQLVPAQAEKGILTSIDKNKMASAIIDIASGYDISTLYVRHLNGISAGAVFSLSIEEKNPTSIAAEKPGHNLTLYPNPNIGISTLAGTVASEHVHLELFNEAGQKVYEKGLQVKDGQIQEVISLSGSIPGGVYLLKVKNGTNVETLRFTLSR